MIFIKFEENTLKFEKQCLPALIGLRIPPPFQMAADTLVHSPTTSGRLRDILTMASVTKLPIVRSNLVEIDLVFGE